MEAKLHDAVYFVTEDGAEVLDRIYAFPTLDLLQGLEQDGLGLVERQMLRLREGTVEGRLLYAQTRQAEVNLYDAGVADRRSHSIGSIRLIQVDEDYQSSAGRHESLELLVEFGAKRCCS